MELKHILFVFLIAAGSTLSGVRGEDLPLTSLEYRIMAKLRSTMELHMAATGSLPTNITDLTNFVTAESFALWEEQFKKFGDQAGFANSIFEKYALLPAGVNFRIGPSTTEMVLINAKPILDDEQVPNRWVIHRSGNILYQSLLAEDKVQAILREAGTKVPEPAAMVSAIQLDAPRRQAELERQQEMEDDIRRLEQEENNHKSTPTRFARRPIEHEKDNEQTDKPSVSTPNPNSALRPLFIVLVALLGASIGLFSLRRK